MLQPALQHFMMFRGPHHWPLPMSPAHPTCIGWGRSFLRSSSSTFLSEGTLMATVCHGKETAASYSS